jgi:hypothetical protein
MGRSLERPIISAYFFKPDRLLADDWPPCPSLRADSLPATRLSASEMSYFSLLVISDMVMAKPREVQHTLRATLITQRFNISFQGAEAGRRIRPSRDRLPLFPRFIP